MLFFVNPGCGKDHFVRCEGAQGNLLRITFSTRLSTVARAHRVAQVLHSRWTFHASRINSLAWTADGAHLASGSLDTHLYVWSIAKVRPALHVMY